MSARTRPRTPPPILRPRDLLRLMSLLMMCIFVLWAITKANNPRTWEWLFPDAEIAQKSAPAEAEPAPAETPPKVGKRRAPVPDQTIVNGAWDRQRFLLDDPAKLDDEDNFRDANARYHLLQLAADAKAEDLAADARRDVRYTALLQSPENYRGQVVHVEGELRRVTHFELKREIPGIEHFYQGWITAGGRDRIYCILFPELPPGFPPERDWGWQVLPIQFDGYFLKILKAEDPSRKDKPVLVPVLIGRTVILPPPAKSNLISIATIITVVFVATIGVCGVAVWLYRRGDRRLAEQMARLKENRKLPELESSETAESPGPDFTIEPIISLNGENGESQAKAT